MQKQYYTKILVIALFCASLLLIGNWLPLTHNAPIVSAHAFVIGSDPIDGSTIHKPPTLVRIYFDAPISTASQATVIAFAPGSSDSQVVSINHGTINATNPKELDIALLPPDKLPQGGYEVKWTALSLTDGHTSSGLIGFNLGFSNTGVDGIPTLGPVTSNHFPELAMQGILSIAWDWLVMVALLFWVGMLVTELFILPRAFPERLLDQARKRSHSLQILCLAGLLVGEGINLILRVTAFTQTLSESGISQDASGGNGVNLNVLGQFALNTNYGHFWLARMGLLVAALLLFWWGGNYQRARITAPSATGKKSKRLRQLRQQVRLEGAAANNETPTPARSPARVSGAVVTNGSSSRASTGAQPRITALDALAESPANQLPPWLSYSGLILAGCVILTLVLSDELLQLTSLPLSAGLLSILSLIAQAIWFGSLAYPGFILLPAQPATNSDQHADMLIRVLKQARPLLLVACGILLVSELFLNEAVIQTPFQFFDNPYGRALLVRDALLVVMFIVTGFIFFILQPRLQRQAVLLPVVTAEMPARRTRTFKLEQTERAIKRTLHVFSGMAAVSLVCITLMNFFSPPVAFPDIDYAALVNQPSTSQTTSQTQSIGGLTITLNVTPARVGTANTVSLTLNDAQGKAVNNATIRLTINMQIMDMGIAHATINGGNTTYTTTFNASQAFTMAGLWVIQAEIEQPGQQTINATFRVMAT